MSSTLLLVGILVPLAFLVVWFSTANVISTSMPAPPQLRNKRIILLIAHPDDEAMFFSPTLLALTHPSLGNHLKILCLSTGDADGLGQTRAKELIDSALTLGVRKREDVFVMDDPRFRDGMDTHWRPEDVCRVLGQAFAPQIVTGGNGSPPPAPTTTGTDKEKPNQRRKLSKHHHSNSQSLPKSPSTPSPPPPPGPRATIDVLLTFDADGVSSHPNHKSLHAGAHLFLQAVMKGHTGYACPVTLYTLPTTNVVRKYTFVLDTLPTLLSGIFSAIVPSSSKKAGSKAAKRVVFVNSIPQYWRARRAMVSGHRSQMRWFRWGWIGTSRYMVVNDLVKEG